MDYYELIVSRELRELKEISLIASRTLLGWTVHGRSFMTSERGLIFNLNKVENKQKEKSKRDEELDSLIKSTFSLESIGVNNFPRESETVKRARQILDSTSRRVGNAWETGLLWAEDNLEIPESRRNAFNRLRLIEKRLDRDEQFAELYYREMDRLFSEGYAEFVESEEVGKRIWYLPHFGVRNVNKPNKVRLVFDAAAKSSNISFNDLVLTGMDLMNSLPGVVMRSRERAIAFKADLRDMFLRIGIRKEDRDAQRFLWRGRSRCISPRVCVMKTVLFGATSSACSANYIKNRNAEEFLEKYPVAAKAIVRDSYMDDFLSSQDSEDEVIEQITQTIEINKAAGWEMHAWACNKKEILEKVLKTESTRESVSLVTMKDCCERVLGLKWDTALDEFGFQLGEKKISEEVMLGVAVPTKREFLRIIMSLYDPLGFLSPFSVEARMIMQNVWLSKIGWDERLKELEFFRWKEWLSEFRKLNSFRVARCYQIDNFRLQNGELHVFCDASEKAYSAVAYWRFCNSNYGFHTSFIIAKSRVAPLTPITIPRLELQAAVIGCRLAKFIAEEHTYNIVRRFFWSDSVTVLRWIRTDPREFKTFVTHRLGEINDLSRISEWRWVPSALNPADDGTRWSPEALLNDSRWLQGPSFLRKSSGEWPSEAADQVSGEDELRERKSNTRSINVCIFNAKFKQLDFLPDISRFSSWSRLLGAIKCVLRAKEIFLKRGHRSSDVELLNLAENSIFKHVQLTFFAKEFLSKVNSTSFPKGSCLSKFTPELDENELLRVNGRVKVLPPFNLPFKPVILHAKHPAVKLLIKFYHEKYWHGSHETVVNEMRQKFWIIRLRSVLRQIINTCLVCRLTRARPPEPQMADLPSFRLAFKSRPFTHCGLDYFGSISVRVGRRTEKRWGALFTCLTVRAVHIELAHSLSADSAIMALLRFAARRGFPEVIYSDNGTNFRGASEELRNAIRVLDLDKITEYASKRQINWIFNPPSAPHMGGAWERMIRSVKSALAIILKEQSPREETPITALAEIEHSLNSRPLTNVPLDSQDEEAFTPNHFLIGTSSAEIRLGNFELESFCSKRQWKIAQRYAEMFWRRWRREYVPTLLARNKWEKKGEDLAEGDVVLIIDDNAPRNEWRKGLVQRILPGKDGQVRVVELETARGSFLRPSRKLIRLFNSQSRAEEKDARKLMFTSETLGD